MAKQLVWGDPNEVTAIANAIRDKTGDDTLKLTMADMPEAISNIPGPDFMPTGTIRINSYGLWDVSEYEYANFIPNPHIKTASTAQVSKNAPFIVFDVRGIPENFIIVWNSLTISASIKNINFISGTVISLDDSDDIKYQCLFAQTVKGTTLKALDGSNLSFSYEQQNNDDWGTFTITCNDPDQNGYFNGAYTLIYLSSEPDAVIPEIPGDKDTV